MLTNPTWLCMYSSCDSSGMCAGFSEPAGQDGEVISELCVHLPHLGARSCSQADAGIPRPPPPPGTLPPLPLHRPLPEWGSYATCLQCTWWVSGNSHSNMCTAGLLCTIHGRVQPKEGCSQCKQLVGLEVLISMAVHMVAHLEVHLVHSCFTAYTRVMT